MIGEPNASWADMLLCLDILWQDAFQAILVHFDGLQPQRPCGAGVFLEFN